MHAWGLRLGRVTAHSIFSHTAFPCPTLQVRPLDRPRMARGQSGLLCLSLYDSLIHYSTPVYPDAIPAESPLNGLGSKFLLTEHEQPMRLRQSCGVLRGASDQ